jgi:putative ABC transport system ATP-binding protein
VSALELRDVVKHYRVGAEHVPAIDGVSLMIAPGEFVAVYGPSGSGKTTLLLLAGGLVMPDQGVVLFDANDLFSLSAKARALYRRRDVGFISQSFHLMAGGSALDNAALKLLPDGWSLEEAQRAARPWLERVGLGERMEHKPAELSMGERQRVTIARALVNEPRLLLADEPTGNLDSKRSRETLGLLRGICHEHDIPSVLVTHDPQAAAFMDRVHTLRDGRLTEGLDAELGVLSQ